MTLSRFVLVAAAAVTFAPGARAQINVVSKMVVQNEATRGGRYTGVIVLHNVSDESQEAKVYQTDYESHADGTAAFGVPATSVRSNAKWIALSPTYLTLPAGETAEVRYTVAVPDDTAVVLAGSYWSLVMIEGIAKGSAESSRQAAAGDATGKLQVGVRTVMRHAVQMVTEMSNTGTATVEFSAVAVLADSAGRKALRFDVVNTGQRAYRPKVGVELYDASGKQVASFKAVHGLTYPGSGFRQSFALAAVPAGRYRALVVVDAGDDDVFGTQFTVAF